MSDEKKAVPTADSTEKKTGKPTLKQRLEEHLAEYGPIALVIYLSISALTIAGFYIAIKTGFHSGESSSGTAGTLLAAWLAAKLTLPLRIGATFVLTPIGAAIMHKFGKGKPKRPDAKEELSELDS